MSLPHRRSAVTRRIAAGVLAVVITAAAVALAFNFARRRAAVASAARATRPAAVAPVPAESLWHVQADTLHPRETLSGLLARAGLGAASVRRVLAAATDLHPRSVPAGMIVQLRRQGSDSAPSQLAFQLSQTRTVEVRRAGDSLWTASLQQVPWHDDTLALSGTIRANLYQGIDDAADSLLPAPARAELAWSMADIYEYRVDMTRDLRPGDTFRVLFVRERTPTGLVRIGHILAARFTLSGTTTTAYRFVDGAGRMAYFDQAGRSLRAAFLRVPLQFRRISSGFGMRLHPILGIVRPHDGIDYAAAAGTPVRAIGDGRVIFAGWRGGYGNAIEIRHRNGFVSLYGHMRAFAHGIRRGRVVSIGHIIGYVGSTGLSTGPHLHFEILVHGRARDPSRALRSVRGFPLPSGERARFAADRTQLAAALDAPTRPTRLAARQ